MNGHPRFLVCADTPDDVGLIPIVLEGAGCAMDLSWRNGGYGPVSFDPSRHIGLIILGTENNAHSNNKRVYGTEMSWVTNAVSRGTALLGICHGAQLLAHTRGASLHYGSSMADRGLTWLCVTPAGNHDPVVWHVMDAQVPQCHCDTFEVPEGAVDLAQSTNQNRPHSDAFRIGRNVYGLGFHPEPTVQMLMNGWSRRRLPTQAWRLVEETGRVVLGAWVRVALSNQQMSTTAQIV
jgi:GMP synthase-like glutamine amidotransferase